MFEKDEKEKAFINELWTLYVNDDALREASIVKIVNTKFLPFLTTTTGHHPSFTIDNSNQDNCIITFTNSAPGNPEREICGSISLKNFTNLAPNNPYNRYDNIDIEFSNPLLKAAILDKTSPSHFDTDRFMPEFEAELTPHENILRKRLLLQKRKLQNLLKKPQVLDYLDTGPNQITIQEDKAINIMAFFEAVEKLLQKLGDSVAVDLLSTEEYGMDYPHEPKDLKQAAYSHFLNTLNSLITPCKKRNEMPLETQTEFLWGIVDDLPGGRAWKAIPRFIRDGSFSLEMGKKPWKVAGGILAGLTFSTAALVLGIVGLVLLTSPYALIIASIVGVAVGLAGLIMTGIGIGMGARKGISEEAADVIRKLEALDDQAISFMRGYLYDPSLETDTTNELTLEEQSQFHYSPIPRQEKKSPYPEHSDVNIIDPWKPIIKL